MGRFLRTDTNSSSGHSQLKPPTVVLTPPLPAGFDAVHVHVVTIVEQPVRRLRQRQPRYELRPPTAVFPPNAYGGPGVKLADPAASGWRYFRRREYVLRPPVSVGAGISFSGPRVKLVDTAAESQQFIQTRRRARSNLPTVIVSTTTPATTPVVSFGPRVMLVGARAQFVLSRRRPTFKLRPPTVTATTAVFSGPPATLTYRDLRRVKRHSTYNLFPPAVITTTLAPPIAGELTPVRDRNPRVTSKLRAPTAVATGQIFSGPSINLVGPRSRNPSVQSHLFEPTTIDLTPQVEYLYITIAPSRRGTPKSVLRAPAVVATATPFLPIRVELARIRPPKTVSAVRQVVYAARVFAPVKVELALSKRDLRRSYFLRGPAVTFVAPVYQPPVRTTLVRIRPARTNAKLRPPTVVASGQLFYGPAVSLAPPRDRRPATKGPFYVFPYVVVQASQLGEALVQLTRIRPARVTSILRKPTVVTGPSLTYPTRVELARIRPVRTRYRLGAPVVNVAPQAVYVENRRLPVRIKPPRTIRRLGPPVVIDNSPQTFYLNTTLAYSRRGAPKSLLFKPADTVGLEDQGKIRTQLARIRPVRTIGQVRGPLVIDIRAQTFYLSVTLAYSLRGKPKSTLAKAAVVSILAAGELQTHLAYSRRGKPRSFFNGPYVLASQPATGDVLVSLAYSLRGRPKSFFIGPTVANVTVTRASGSDLTSLARIRPPKTISRLRPPTVVTAAVVTYPIRVALVRIRPVRTIADLRLPTDTTGLEDQGRIAVHLAPSKRGRPLSHLAPPTAVFPFFARPIRATFVRIRRVRSIFRLAPPIIPPVAPPIDAELAVQLVRVRLERRLAISRLAPPVVVQAFIARSTETALVRIRPARTLAILRPPTDTTGLEDQGRVQIHLAPSKRGRPLSVLRPPTVVAQFAARPIATHLTYSQRGLAKPIAIVPLVVTVTASAFGYVAVWLTYSKRGTPKSKLSAPAVAATSFARPVEIALTRIRPQHVTAHLAPPTVVQPFVARQTKVALTYSLRGKAKSALFEPAVIDNSPQVFYLSVTLARNKPQPTTTLLEPPAVVTPFNYPVVTTLYVHTTRIKPQPIHSILRPPTVVGPVLARAIDVTFAPQSRGKAKSLLRKVIYDARVYAPIRVELAPSRFGKPISKLFAPAVVQAFIARPVDATLARLRPVATHSALRPPTVVYTAVEIYGPEVSLAPSKRGTPKSRLFPPTDVVDRMDIGLLAVHLAPSKHGRPLSRLAPPTVVFPFFARPTDVTIARIRPPKTIARLAPPTDTTGLEDQGSVSVTLVRIRPVPTHAQVRGPVIVSLPDPVVTDIAAHLAYSLRGQPLYRLGPPALIDVSPQVFYLSVTLVRNKPQPTTAFLTPPAVVTPFNYPVDTTVHVHLTRIKPQPIHSVLRKPTVVAPVLARAIDITLAPQKRGVPKPFLRKVIYDARVYAPIRVELASSRFPQPKSILRKPTVVQPFLARPIDATFVRIRPPETLARLFAPTDTTGLEDQGNVVVTLAPSRFGKPKSRLQAPTVVQAFVQRPIETALARIRPAATHSVLREPVVVYTAVEIYGPDVSLAPSTRGRPLSILRPPTDTVGVEDQGRIKTVFVRIAPPAVRSTLRTPTVVREFIARAIAVSLIRITPPPVRSFLRPMLFAEPARPEERFEVTTAFAESRRPKFSSFLPKVIYDAKAYAPITVTLAPQPKPTTLSALLPPAAVGRRPFRGIQTYLVRITPPPVHPQLLPPAVIDTRPQVFYLKVRLARIRPVPVYPKLSLTEIVFSPFVAAPIFVWLAPSSRGVPHHFHVVPTSLRFVPPRGDICGYDTTPTEVCGDDETTTLATGVDSSTSMVTGTDRTGTNIDGGDSTDSGISGFDRKAT